MQSLSSKSQVMACVAFDENLQPSIVKTHDEFTKNKGNWKGCRDAVCCYPGCTNSGSTFNNGGEKDYKMIPVPLKDATRAAKWLTACGLDLNKIPNKPTNPEEKLNAYLCDGHFSVGLYHRSQKTVAVASVSLKKSAIPDVLKPNPNPLYYATLKDFEQFTRVDTENIERILTHHYVVFSANKIPTIVSTKATRNDDYCCSVQCSFPGCENTGTTRFLNNKIGQQVYIMYKLEAKTFSFLRWVERMGLKVKDIPPDPENTLMPVEVYLCDGHFSLRQYRTPNMDGYSEKNEMRRLRNAFKLDHTAMPDVLMPNPLPIYYVAFKNLQEKKSLDDMMCIKDSQMKSVPTSYNVKVGKRHLPENFMTDDLIIKLEHKVCCFCARPCASNSVSILNPDSTACSTFGRVISLLTSLTETPLLSGYACAFCANKSLACFGRLVEVNAKLIVAGTRVDSNLNINDIPNELPCTAANCNKVLESLPEFQDHLFQHILEKSVTDTAQKSSCDQDEDGDDNGPAKDQCPVEHDHSTMFVSVKPEIRVTGPPDAGLCELCGEVTDRITPHLSKHHSVKKSQALQMENKKLCPICGQGFRSLPDHIARHDENFIDTHGRQRNRSFLTGTTFTSCTKCPMKFKTREERDDHLKDVHDQESRSKYRKCYYCDFFGYHGNTLKRHLKENHMDKIVARCEDCNKDFFHESALLIHNAAKHPALHKTYQKQKALLLRATQRENPRKRRDRKRPADDTYQLFEQARDAKRQKAVANAIRTVNKQPTKVTYATKYSGIASPRTPERRMAESRGRTFNQMQPIKSEKGYSGSGSGGKWKLPRLDNTPDDEPEDDNIEYDWGSPKKEEAVEYMEQVAATEYLVMERGSVKKFLGYL